ncbi:MAG: hypothetical protein ACI936_002939 [Paraglaciecola sp.]|jgi:hypothetical protein
MPITGYSLDSLLINFDALTRAKKSDSVVKI